MARMRAVWNGTVLAQSDATVVVEGNHYFPPDSVDQSVLRAGSMSTVCPWKGRASYYDIEVDGLRTSSAAWYYAAPLPAAAEIAGHLAFWKDVVVEPAPVPAGVTT